MGLNNSRFTLGAPNKSSLGHKQIHIKQETNPDWARVGIINCHERPLNRAHREPLLVREVNFFFLVVGAGPGAWLEAGRGERSLALSPSPRRDTGGQSHEIARGKIEPEIK